MTATSTFDIFTSLDGNASYGPPGDWGGYWGKQGPEFLDPRLAAYDGEQRVLFGATTFSLVFTGPPSGPGRLAEQPGHAGNARSVPAQRGHRPVEPVEGGSPEDDRGHALAVTFGAVAAGEEPEVLRSGEVVVGQPPLSP